MQVSSAKFECLHCSDEADRIHIHVSQIPQSLAAEREEEGFVGDFRRVLLSPTPDLKEGGRCTSESYTEEHARRIGRSQSVQKAGPHPCQAVEGCPRWVSRRHEAVKGTQSLMRKTSMSIGVAQDAC